jgi:nucleotide-binding universal stress UspA family protein
MPNEACPYQQILFASDLSSRSRTAFEVALQITLACQAQLTLLHVFEYGAELPETRLAPGTELRRLHDEAASALERLVNSAQAAGVDCAGVLDCGDPADTILAILTERKTDLLVMGTNALRGMERMVFGSTAESVLRRARCPVLTVGPHVPSSAAKVREGPVLFATDFRPAAVRAIRGASAYARAIGAPLECVHVLPPSLAESATQIVPEVILDALHRIVAESSGLEVQPQCTVQFSNEVPEEIVAFARKQKARAIVLGVRHGNALTPHAAPMAAFRVIAGASCPVLTLAAGV